MLKLCPSPYRFAERLFFGRRLFVHGAVQYDILKIKDEVREVPAGQECGMAFENYEDIRQGDVIECFRIEQVTRTL